MTHTRTHADPDAKQPIHIRPWCNKHPFCAPKPGVDAAGNEEFCGTCFCVPCDMPAAQCASWAGNHCHATWSPRWRQIRDGLIKAKGIARVETPPDDVLDLALETPTDHPPNPNPNWQAERKAERKEKRDAEKERRLKESAQPSPSPPSPLPPHALPAAAHNAAAAQQFTLGMPPANVAIPQPSSLATMPLPLESFGKPLLAPWSALLQPPAAEPKSFHGAGALGMPAQVPHVKVEGVASPGPTKPYPVGKSKRANWQVKQYPSSHMLDWVHS